MLKCLKPYINEFGAHPCRKCICCRVSYSNQWFNRLMLETASYSITEILFCTFTYNNENLPTFEVVNEDTGEIYYDVTLQKDVHQSFFKRVRRMLEYRYGVDTRQVRYYWCGEYGKEKGRPHYHCILFGVNLNYANDIAECWHYGNTKICPLVNAKKGRSKGYGAMRYVCKYTLKDCVHKGYGDRVSPFSRKSQGLGKSILNRIDTRLKLLNAITNGVNVNGAFYKLGRFLTDKALLNNLTEEEYLGYKEWKKLEMFVEYMEEMGSAPPDLYKVKQGNPYHISKLERHFKLIVDKSKPYAESLESAYRARELKEAC